MSSAKLSRDSVYLTIRHVGAYAEACSSTIAHGCAAAEKSPIGRQRPDEIRIPKGVSCPEPRAE
jgi:hypothetical protein